MNEIAVRYIVIIVRSDHDSSSVKYRRPRQIGHEFGIVDLYRVRWRFVLRRREIIERWRFCGSDVFPYLYVKKINEMLKFRLSSLLT
jgi:hypothetical protein